MTSSFSAVLRLLAVAALFSGCASPEKAPATNALTPLPPPVAEWEPILETPYGASGWAAVIAEVQRNLVLPLGTPVPAPDSRVVVRFEVRQGMVEKAWVLHSMTHVTDSAVLAAVNMLNFTNGPGSNGPPFYTLVVSAPGAASAAQRREATRAGSVPPCAYPARPIPLS